ncbi:uncharacterized protein SPAPADRAFT_53310 [Spathaspora passalidarum NRRL Y-27907]|uniref:Uncharacterized protein n=1 Tax=Spathaspora passalidarum (strain NRRL Y-27907 / 11-Y1) TaxID=619300 RepID=G3AFD5_SPAPN|nr:uncharacterized protein SPAPADRAFT_53310 [Spathaspora passalidarum NRRL Y-27907]EGW34924.1 hypothetical protein SPAPADRAFT_53310 [Spathaspora passalidarum NRRL Y-27907]
MSLNLALPGIPKPAEFIPVFTFNLKLASDPTSIFSDPASDKALSLATVSSGEVKTVANSLGLEFEVVDISGWDDLSLKISASTNSLDCKLYGKTPSGAGVFIHYGGKVQLTESTINVVTKKTQVASIEESYVTCNPTFQLDEAVEDKYKWVLKENFFGRGRFGRDDDGTLYVQYYVYVIR